MIKKIMVMTLLIIFMATVWVSVTDDILPEARAVGEVEILREAENKIPDIGASEEVSENGTANNRVVSLAIIGAVLAFLIFRFTKGG